MARKDEGVHVVCRPGETFGEAFQRAALEANWSAPNRPNHRRQDLVVDVTVLGLIVFVLAFVLLASRSYAERCHSFAQLGEAECHELAERRDLRLDHVDVVVCTCPEAS